IGAVGDDPLLCLSLHRLCAGRTVQGASLGRCDRFFCTRGLLVVLRSISARQQQILPPHYAGGLDAIDRGLCWTIRSACRRIGAANPKAGSTARHAKEWTACPATYCPVRAPSFRSCTGDQKIPLTLS